MPNEHQPVSHALRNELWRTLATTILSTVLICFIQFEFFAHFQLPEHVIINAMPSRTGGSLNLSNSESTTLPSYSYFCHFYARSKPLSTGFLGLGKTAPIWFYHVWIGNLSINDITDICITAHAPPRSQFIVLKSSFQGFKSTPSGNGGSNYVQHHSSVSGFLRVLKAAHAARVTVAVASQGMPTPAQLRLSIWCEDHQFRRASGRLWNTTWAAPTTP